MRRRVVLLVGDSVLDDFYWLKDPKQNLTNRMRHLFPPDVTVINLAVDQMSTFDFVERCGTYLCDCKQEKNTWLHYQHARETRRHIVPCASSAAASSYSSSSSACLPDDTKLAAPFSLTLKSGCEFNDIKYPTDPDGHIRSVENIRRIAAEHDVVAIFLSIGGNDVYLHADIQRALISSLVPFRGAQELDRVTREFATRYTRILDAIGEAAPRAAIVPVIPYHPHYGFSLIAGSSSATGGCIIRAACLLQRLLLSKLATPLIESLLRVAQSRGLRVIDLSRTFDPKNAKHYGTGDPMTQSPYGAPWSGAEPSTLSNEMTAQLMLHVYKEIATTRAPVPPASSSSSQLNSKSVVTLYWMHELAIRGTAIVGSAISSYRFGVCPSS